MCAREWRAALLLAVIAGIAPALAQQPSAAQGAQIAAQGTPQGVSACIGCHGTLGEGSAVFPRLAGTGQTYLQAQLDAFADGSRASPIMQPFAQKLSAPERTALAMYFSQLKAPFVAADSASPTPDDAGAWLATRGRWVDQLPACAQCHGPGGRGVGAQFPPLAGLPVAYITKQLQAWKAGTRPTGPLGLMPAVARKLSDQDIDAVAAYYAARAGAPTAAPDAAAANTNRKGHQP